MLQLSLASIRLRPRSHHQRTPPDYTLVSLIWFRCLFITLAKLSLSYQYFDLIVTSSVRLSLSWIEIVFEIWSRHSLTTCPWVGPLLSHPPNNFIAEHVRVFSIAYPLCFSVCDTSRICTQLLLKLLPKLVGELHVHAGTMETSTPYLARISMLNSMRFSAYELFR